MKRDWITVLPLWVAAPLLLWLSLARPVDSSGGLAAALPGTVAGFVLDRDYPITSRMWELLGSDDATWRRYRHPELGEVFVIGVFHGNNWRAVHPPETCLRGANLEIESTRLQADSLGDGRARSHSEMVLRSQDAAQRQYLSYSVFVAAPDLTTGSYAEFFWHHAPRALLRRELSGGLLRIETWVGAGGIEAARRRCGTMLTGLVPVVEASLR